MYNFNMFMAFISWWYGKGWALKAEKIMESLDRSIDYFSLGILIKTWFSPFHQIDAGKFSNAPFDVRMRKFFDRSFSRVFGAFLRTIVMLVGIIVIAFKAILGLITLVFWPILPAFPVLFMGVFLSGWTPPIIDNLKKNFTPAKEVKQEETTDKKSIFDFGGLK